MHLQPNTPHPTNGKSAHEIEKRFSEIVEDIRTPLVNHISELSQLIKNYMELTGRLPQMPGTCNS